jgi:copper chaperone CopZ
MTPSIFFIALSFKVLGIDCTTCAPPVVRALSAVRGVKNATVDEKSDTATVDVPAGFDRAKIREALSNAGYEVEFPDEKLPDLFIKELSADVVKTLDIQSFNGRTRLDLDKLAVPGKVTIFDYYADWCVPCHVLEARLQRYLKGHPKVALRRLNIGNWDNVAAHQAADLGATALPYLVVYDGKGKVIAAVTGGDWGQLLAAVER